MRVLIIGSGGREHALAHTCFRQGHEVFCFPGNAGTKKFCNPLFDNWKDIRSDDYEALASFCKAAAIDITIVGPEVPLEHGIVDVFYANGLKIFGPNKQASRIECNKSWSKSFMARNAISTARFVVCNDGQQARKAIEANFHEWGGVVIKPTGLTAGKGVMVCQTIQEAENAIKMIMEDKLFGAAGDEVIIEEILKGCEVSIIAFCDGKTMVPMIPAQDHKRLYDGGQGPNTGGVGAYTPTPFLLDDSLKEIQETMITRTLEALKKEGINYVGFLYFGIMLTEQGPKMLEYNCRLGDPEAQAILPSLETDLASIAIACCEGRLAECDIMWMDQATCCVVMVSRGYPKTFRTGFVIHGLDQVEGKEGVIIFHGGTAVNEDGATVTSGGRVLGVTGVAPTLDEAIKNAYDAINQISFEGVYYRTDIASQARVEPFAYV